MKQSYIIPNRSLHTQRGLSLVELMIAMALGLIVLAGVLSLFLTNKQSYTLENAVARVQEGGRFSLDFMRPTLRQAGYTGCGGQDMWSDPNMNLLKNYNTDDTFNFAHAILGYDYSGTSATDSYTIASDLPTAASAASNWTPALPSDVWSAIGSTIVPGSDVIMLHVVNPGGISVKPPTGGGGGSAASIKVFDGNQIGGLLGQIGYITNCQQSAIFQITNVTTSSGTVVHSSSGSFSPGNASQGKANNMTAPAQLFTASTVLYFIGIGADGGPSLYTDSLNGSISSIINNVGLNAPQELVPGVENMQLLYGVDTDGDGIANQYIDASQVSDWTSVAIVSIRLALLVRSDTGVIPLSNPGTFDLNDVAITPPASAGSQATRMRKVFVETIALRNHVK